MNALGATLLIAASLASGTTDYADLLQHQQRGQQIPGAAAVVVHKDTIVYAGGAGMADLTLGLPVTADTAFYLGSVSKVLTAVLVLGLAEDGTLPLDRKLDLGNPSHSLAMTPKLLLSHASGLPREGPFNYWFTAAFPSQIALLDFARRAELEFPPGHGMRYSNIGYAALGQSAAIVLDSSFEQLLESRLLGPLDMKRSGARGPSPDIAIGYTPPGRLLPSADRPFAGVGKQAGERRIREYHDANGMAPAFGAYSTATDMAEFIRFLLVGGDDVKPTEAQRARLWELQPSGWGLGLEPARLSGRRVARHTGWFAAHRSHVLIDPAAKLGIVVMTNSDDADPAQIAEALFDAARSAMATSGSP